jgi:hypothetical protein
VSAVAADTTIISIRVNVPVLCKLIRETEPSLDRRQLAEDGVARHALHPDYQGHGIEAAR